MSSEGSGFRLAPDARLIELRHQELCRDNDNGRAAAALLVCALFETRCTGSIMLDYVYPTVSARVASQRPLSRVSRSATADRGDGTDVAAIWRAAEGTARHFGGLDVTSTDLALALLSLKAPELVALLHPNELAPEHAWEAIACVFDEHRQLPPPAKWPPARRPTIYDVPEPYRSMPEVRDSIEVEQLWPDEMYQDSLLVGWARRRRPANTDQLVEYIVDCMIMSLEIERVGEEAGGR